MWRAPFTKVVFVHGILNSAQLYLFFIFTFQFAFLWQTRHALTKTIFRFHIGSFPALTCHPSRALRFKEADMEEDVGEAGVEAEEVGQGEAEAEPEVQPSCSRRTGAELTCSFIVTLPKWGLFTCLLVDTLNTLISVPKNLCCENLYFLCRLH